MSRDLHSVIMLQRLVITVAHPQPGDNPVDLWKPLVYALCTVTKDAPQDGPRVDELHRHPQAAHTPGPALIRGDAGCPQHPQALRPRRDLQMRRDEHLQNVPVLCTVARRSTFGSKANHHRAGVVGGVCCACKAVRHCDRGTWRRSYDMSDEQAAGARHDRVGAMGRKRSDR